MMVAVLAKRTPVVTSYTYEYCALAFVSSDDWAVILTTTAHVRFHADNKVVRITFLHVYTNPWHEV